MVEREYPPKRDDRGTLNDHVSLIKKRPTNCGAASFLHGVVRGKPGEDTGGTKAPIPL